MSRSEFFLHLPIVTVVSRSYSGTMSRAGARNLPNGAVFGKAIDLLDHARADVKGQ